jgi:single-strand DNA-binding protein
MSSLNKVTLIGNVGADPEIRSTQSGDKIASIRLATSEKWRDKSSGETKEKTEWHSVVVFNEGLVKVVESYVRKGSKLYLEGQLQTRKWTDKDGSDRYSTEVVLQRFRGEIVLLSEKTGDDAQRERSNRERLEAAYKQDARGASSPRTRDMSEDIPFSMEWR